MRELDDGADALLRLDAGVRRRPSTSSVKRPTPLRAVFSRAAGQRRLQHQHVGGARGPARSISAREVGLPISSSDVNSTMTGRRGRSPSRTQRDSTIDEAGLHVEDARPVGPAVLDAERPLASVPRGQTVSKWQSTSAGLARDRASKRRST